MGGVVSILFVVNMPKPVVKSTDRRTSGPQETLTASTLTSDEIEIVKAQLQNPLTGIKTHEYKWRLHTHTQCFTGADGVEWLLNNTPIVSVTEAEALGQRLMMSGAFRPLATTSAPFRAHKCLYQMQTPRALRDLNELDNLFKEYLLYRGMTQSLATFQQELQQDRMKELEAERISKELFRLITEFKLSYFLDFWKYLDDALFSRVDRKYLTTAQDLEASLFKYYIANAIQANQTPRVHEFFQVCVDRLSGDERWATWFSLPYVASPQSKPEFALYFTKHWADQLSASVTNFISTCLHEAPLPRIVLFNLEQAARESLELELEAMRKQNETLRRYRSNTAGSTLSSAGTEEASPASPSIKVDANKPQPNQEIARPPDDSDSHLVFLGKQRQGPEKNSRDPAFSLNGEY